MLEIEIAGRTVDEEYSRLAVTGLATLGGTLDVELVDFAPEPGDTFRVLTFSEREGEFTAYNLPELPEGLVWEVAWGDTYLDLNVLVQSGSLRSNR